jgi:effector-binding domain-containing protein
MSQRTTNSPSMQELGITLKSNDSFLAACLRFKYRSGVEGQIAPQLEKLEEICRDAISGPALAYFHWGTVFNNQFDVEVCYPVSRNATHPEVDCRTIEATEAMTIIHQGSRENIRESYRRLLGYMKDHGIIGQESSREVYLVMGRTDPREDMTEIQALLHPWNAIFEKGLRAWLGEEARELVMRGSQEFTAATSKRAKIDWAILAMQRLDMLANEDQKYQILSPCADCFPHERIEALRAIYLRHQDVDEVLAAMQEDVFWYAKPRREGNLILERKLPFNQEGHAKATTPEEKRKTYCHCVLVRDNIEEIPPTYCYCGSGWYRQLWEGVLGRPLKLEVLKTITRGDDYCEFAIHLEE